MEDLADLETPIPTKSYYLSGLSPVRPTALGITQTTETPGQTPLVVNGVVVGPFEEEEEEISIHSDGGRGKWRDFRPGAATQHLQSATAQGRAAVEGFSPTSPRAHWIRPE